MTTAPTELKPSAPAVGGVMVKPLRWIERTGHFLGMWGEDQDEYTIVKGVEHYRVYSPGTGGYLGAFDTLEAAMAAAQAHHEAAILSALEPQAVDDAMVWQPIETAPKDGTVVLAVTVEAQNPKARLAWFEGEGWVRIWKSENFVIDGPLRWRPTHWMPLPASPAALQAAKGDE